MAPSALPAASFAAVVIVAVYCVLAARLAEGVNRAVVPVMLTAPATTAPPVVLTSVKLAPLSVELVIVSENAADTEVFVATLVAAFAGNVEDTVGGVISGAALVVKRQTKLDCKALPATSFAAVVMVAVYCVLAARLAEGTNTTPVPLALTAPTTCAPPVAVFTVKLVMVRLLLSIASEKFADTDVFKLTPVAKFAGEMEETIGGVVSPRRGGGEFAAVPGPTAVDSPPPPPQPNRITLASNAAAMECARIPDPTLLPFDICEPCSLIIIVRFIFRAI